MSTFARQRETPTRSPYAKIHQPRSPTKSGRQELGLSLERVIGSTCQSANRFSADKESNSFAYVAGAAVVLATLDGDQDVTQRFFRANASQTTVTRPPPPHSNGPSTPSALAQEMRSRLGHRAREGSPFTGAAYHHDATTAAADSPGANSGHAKDRVKAATAVALSRGGRWLAVGETGYRPRVLVFAVTERKSTEVPSAIISEHSFGVHAVAFDGEGRLLASLGTINDGFLHVWELDQRSGAATLVASNKCTSLVRQIAWVGRSLVTVGTRFVKVWRPDEVAPSSGVEHEGAHNLSNPGYKPLVGRNCLLGDLLESTFTAVVPVSDSRAIICSDAGHVLLLDLHDNGKQQRLSRVSLENFSITAACLGEGDQVLVAGSNGEVKAVDLAAGSRSDTPVSRSETPTAIRNDIKATIYPMAIGMLQDMIVVSNNTHGIDFRPRTTETANAGLYRQSSLSMHSDAILGIRRVNHGDAAECAFATWSCNGTIIGWSVDGQPLFNVAVALEQINDAYELTNELRTMCFFSDSLVASGDRYGVLRVMNYQTQRTLFNARAHSSEITDIDTCRCQEDLFVATASRDRTIQVFAWRHDNLELVQTLDEHAGSVTQIAFADEGRLLLSCSADRTVVVRELLQSEGAEPSFYTIARTVTLKAAPTAMDLGAATDQIIVATADRLVNTISVVSGKVLASFKSGDNDGGDAVTLSSIVTVHSGAASPMIAAVSSADKSIRIYSEDGNLLARDWGHTEGVTGIALVLQDTPDESAKLASTAADGTLFVWSTQTRKPSLQAATTKTDDVVASSVPSASPLARPPLRKVISVSEMTRLRRSMVSPLSDEGEPTTPTGLKSPTLSSALRKRPSRLSVGQAPKLIPSTPGNLTPTQLSPTATNSPRGSRTPSPSRPPFVSAARSASRSPERVVGAGRRASMNNLRVDDRASTPRLATNGLSLPLRPALTRGVSSKDPNKEGGASLPTRAPSTTDLIENVKAYRVTLGKETCLPGANGDAACERVLRAELESLLRTLSMRSRGDENPIAVDGADDDRDHDMGTEAIVELRGDRAAPEWMGPGNAGDHRDSDTLGGGLDVLDSVEEAMDEVESAEGHTS